MITTITNHPHESPHLHPSSPKTVAGHGCAGASLLVLPEALVGLHQVAEFLQALATPWRFHRRPSVAPRQPSPR